MTSSSFAAMTAQSYLRVAFVVVPVLALTTTPAPALDFGKANPLKWFKSKESKVPVGTEKQEQELRAEAMLRDARTAQSIGNRGRAQSIYKDIVSQYRFTDAAANAQFEQARLIRSEGKLQNSFDAFQKFITDYRQSPQFAAAVQQQFEIAEEARAGKKQPSLLLIPMKLDRSDLVKMYQSVITNSPYGKYASYSQFAIGEVYQDDGDKANANAAFAMVVENYPNTKLASEAQFRIGAITSVAANKTQDARNLVAARDALELYRASNPSGERSGEAESLLSQNSEAQAIKSLEIGKFYESTNKPKAAAIYYNEAVKFGTPEASLEARQRLTALATAYPKELKDSPALQDADFTIPAVADTKGRDDYAGPPAPLLARVGRKPQMRVDDDFRPIPMVEPDLPTRPAGPPQPGMILPPPDAGGTQTPPALPVPPAPEMQAPNINPIPAPPEPPAPAVPVPAAPAIPAPEVAPPAAPPASN